MTQDVKPPSLYSSSENNVPTKETGTKKCKSNLVSTRINEGVPVSRGTNLKIPFLSNVIIYHKDFPKLTKNQRKRGENGKIFSKIKQRYILTNETRS